MQPKKPKKNRPLDCKTGFDAVARVRAPMESPYAATTTTTTSKNQSGGAPALCEGRGGRERLRLHGKVGQVKPNGPVVI